MGRTLFMLTKTFYELHGIEEAAKLLNEQLNIAIENLTKMQLAEALTQAICCGDFQRLVTTDGRQTVTYIPFRREQELQTRIEDLQAENDKLRAQVEMLMGGGSHLQRE